MCKKPGG
jgi:hypothetical protein